MERTITGFDRDAGGDWVAQLSCGHSQHVRHRPPFQLREWVTDDRARNGRIGTPLDCPLCDTDEPEDEGGEPACWLHLVCPECGAMLAGGSHRPGCAGGDPT